MEQNEAVGQIHRRKGMKIRILTLLPLLLIVSGCYDYRETDDMAIVSGLHVAEGAEKAYKLTFEMVGTTSDGGTKATVTAREGDTIAEAIDNATALSGKRLYFGHAQVLAIDYALAQEGIADILDYFTRQNDMRLTINVVATKDIKGEDFFKGQDDEVRSFVIADMLKANEERAITPDTQLYTFISDSFEQGTDGFMPIVNMGNDGNMKVSSAAIFKDAVLTGQLDEDDTKYLMMLNNIGNRGGFILEREQGKPLSFEIRSRKAKIEPHLEWERLICDVELEAQLGILELTGTRGILSREKLDEIEAELGKYVSEQLGSTLDEMSRSNTADVLGIERSLIRKQPELKGFLKENFQGLYKDAYFNVTTKISIIDSGRTLRKLGVQ